MAEMNPALQHALSQAEASARQASPGTPTLDDCLKNMNSLGEPLVKGVTTQGIGHSSDNLMQAISEGKLMQFATGGMDPGKAFQGLQAAQFSAPGVIQNNSVAEGMNVGVVGKGQGR